MTGNFEVEDQDVTDLYDSLNLSIKLRWKDKQAVKRLTELKDRLLKVEVNEF